MRKAWLLCLAVLTAIGWTITASFILCWGMGRLDLWRFPFTQWFDLAWSWHSMLWWPHGIAQYRTHPLPYFLIGGLLPTMLLGSTWWQYLRRRQTQDLYGDSQWATSADMAASGITRRRHF